MAAAMLIGLIADDPIVFVIACGAVGIGIGYTGSMIGPPVIGLFADLTSLTTALYLITVSGAVIGIAGPFAVRSARHPSRTAQCPALNPGGQTADRQL